MTTDHANRLLAACQRLTEAKRTAADVEETWRRTRDELEAARSEVEYLTTVGAVQGAK
jgi:hypothetical protein